MPELQALANRTDGADLVTVLIGGQRDRARSVAQYIKLTAPVLIDDGSLRRAFQVEQTPTTVLLDDTGKAYRVLLGALPIGTIEAAVRERL